MNITKSKAKFSLSAFETEIAPNENAIPAFDMNSVIDSIPSTKALRRNSLVEGTVVNRIKGGFLVDIGRKCDAFVSDGECQGLAIGLTAKFAILAGADFDSPSWMSHNRAINYQKVDELCESGRIVLAQVGEVALSRAGKVAGLHAFVEHQKAFIPRRHVAFTGNLAELEKTEIPVRVIQSKRTSRGWDLMLSNTQAVESQKSDFLTSMKTGQIIDGTVQLILPKELGILVNLGGQITGFVHRTELSADRTSPISELVKIGDTIALEVLSINLNKLEVRLSRKRLLEAEIYASLSIGSCVCGKVQNVAQFGVFVNLGGVSGLLHRSEMSGKDKFVTGDVVEVWVKNVDAQQKRVQLTRRGH